MNTTCFSCNSQQWVDGDTTTNLWFTNGGTPGTSYLWFDFGDTSYVINEAKFYQQLSTAQGTWQWQGSNDGSSWTNIGSTFALGGTTTQTITAMSANTTDYHHYRMLLSSGGWSSSPFLYEMEFKISLPIHRTSGTTTSYTNTGGSGNRTSTISITAAGSLLTQSGTNTAALQTLLDGVTSGQSSVALASPTVTNGYVYFDFRTPQLVDEVSMYFPLSVSAASNNGVIKWQGSNDASTWTDLTGTFDLSNVPFSGDNSANPLSVVFFRQLNGTLTAYRYLRMFNTLGNASNGGLLQEFEFRIGAPITQIMFPTIYQ